MRHSRLVNGKYIKLSVSENEVGAAFVLKGGVLVTAAHLLKDAKVFDTRAQINNFRLSISHIYSSQCADIAVCRLVERFGLADLESSLKQPVLSALNREKYCVIINDCLFGLKLESSLENNAFFSGFEIREGDSGSPVLCFESGALVGVVSGKTTSKNSKSLIRVSLLTSIKDKLERELRDRKTRFRQTSQTHDVLLQKRRFFNSIKTSYSNHNSSPTITLKTLQSINLDETPRFVHGHPLLHKLHSELNYFKALVLVNQSESNETLKEAETLLINSRGNLEILIETQDSDDNLVELMEEFYKNEWLVAVSHKQRGEKETGQAIIEDLKGLEADTGLVYPKSSEVMLNRELAVLSNSKESLTDFVQSYNSSVTSKTTHRTKYTSIKRIFEIATHQELDDVCRKVMPEYCSLFSLVKTELGSLDKASFCKSLYRYYALIGSYENALKYKHLSYSFAKKGGWVGQLKALDEIKAQFGI